MAGKGSERMGASSTPRSEPGEHPASPGWSAFPSDPAKRFAELMAAYADT
jgi:hypothetical protein